MVGSHQATDSSYTYPGPRNFGIGAAREAPNAYPGVYTMNGGRYDQSSGSSNPGHPGVYTMNGGRHDQSSGSSNPGYPSFYTNGRGYNQSSGFSGHNNYFGHHHNSMQQTPRVGRSANSYGDQGYDQTTSGYGSGGNGDQGYDQTTSGYGSVSTVSGYSDKAYFDPNSAQQTPGFGGGYSGYGDQGYGQDTSCFGGGSTDSGYGYSTGIPYDQQCIGASAQQSAGIGGADYYDYSGIADAMQSNTDLCSSIQSMGDDTYDFSG